MSISRLNNFFERNYIKLIILLFGSIFAFNSFLGIKLENKRRKNIDLLAQIKTELNQLENRLHYMSIGYWFKFKENIDYFDVIERPKEYYASTVNEYGGVFKELIERTFTKLTGKDLNKYGIEINFVDKLPEPKKKGVFAYVDGLGRIWIEKGKPFSIAFETIGHELAHLTAEKDYTLEQAVAIAGAKVWTDQLSNRTEYGWNYSCLSMVVSNSYLDVKDPDLMAQTIVGKLYEYYLSQRARPVFKTQRELDRFCNHFVREKETYLQVYYFLAKSSPEEIKVELKRAEKALEGKLVF